MEGVAGVVGSKLAEDLVTGGGHCEVEVLSVTLDALCEEVGDAVLDNLRDVGGGFVAVLDAELEGGMRGGLLGQGVVSERVLGFGEERVVRLDRSLGRKSCVLHTLEHSLGFLNPLVPSSETTFHREGVLDVVVDNPSAVQSPFADEDAVVEAVDARFKKLGALPGLRDAMGVQHLVVPLAGGAAQLLGERRIEADLFGGHFRQAVVRDVAALVLEDGSELGECGEQTLRHHLFLQSSKVDGESSFRKDPLLVAEEGAPHQSQEREAKVVAADVDGRVPALHPVEEVELHQDLEGSHGVLNQLAELAAVVDVEDVGGIVLGIHHGKAVTNFNKCRFHRSEC